MHGEQRVKLMNLVFRVCLYQINFESNMSECVRQVSTSTRQNMLMKKISEISYGYIVDSVTY
jgi:hypothetical protein